MTENLVVPLEVIGRRIYLIRGQKVMLDSDLAELYQAPTNRSTWRFAGIGNAPPKTSCFSLRTKRPVL